MLELIGSVFFVWFCYACANNIFSRYICRRAKNTVMHIRMFTLLITEEDISTPAINKLKSQYLDG